MLLLFNDNQTIAKITFAFSLVLLLVSLYLSLREIQISIEALKIELSEIENTTVEAGNKTEKENMVVVKDEIQEAETQRQQIISNGLG